MLEAQGAELTYDAAVGKDRGGPDTVPHGPRVLQREAASLIVRGFMDVSIFGLPQELEESIERIVKATTEKAL
jgi:hypothetical protein